MNDNDLYYRWILINHQETCYLRVVKLLEGFFKNKESVVQFYKQAYCFDEHLFGVRKIEESATPFWIVKKSGEVYAESVE